MRPSVRCFLACATLLFCCTPALAAQLSGWIEAQPSSVDLTREGSLDWIQAGWKGDIGYKPKEDYATKFERKAGAGLIGALNGVASFTVKSLGASFTWSNGSPSATCAGTQTGIHVGSAITLALPADTAARTVRIYFASHRAGVKVYAHLSDTSAPDWTDDRWYALSGDSSITPVTTISYAAASAGQSLTVTIQNIIPNDQWSTVGIHAVTLRNGAVAVPTPPAPPAPTGLHAFALNGRVVLNWDQMMLVDTYRIYRAVSATRPASPLLSGIMPIHGNFGWTPIRMLNAVDANATNGTAWHYWVSSVNAGGETLVPVGVVATPSDPGSSAITTARALRILPLGDSITQGYPVNGGYRVQLLKNLTAGGYQVLMTGSRRFNSETMDEPYHEGLPGKRIDSLRDEVVDRVLPTYQPDIILLMIGTNHFVDRKLAQTAVDKAIAAYDELLAKILILAPTARVIVAPILPIRDSALPAAFNAALKTRITTLAAQGRPVSWCDMSSITVDQLVDGYHPNAQAYAAMGDLWYKGIQAITIPVKGP